MAEFCTAALSSGVLDVPFGPFDQAERILDFLIDARRDMHVAWRHVQDVTTEHILNFDIRWPPDNGSLLSYEAMATELLTGHVMDLSGEDADTPQAVAVRDYLLRNFFSVAPSSWLERSWGRLAAREGGSRLRDCLNILLDGVPAQATIWRSEDKRQQTKELLHCLCSICNTPRLDDPDDIETGLAGIVSYAEPSPAEEALIRLYGLFWPAVLVHWRCQLFGVAPIQPGSPAAGVLRTFLSRLRDEVPTACLASLRHGLDALAQACEDALVIGADAVGDRRAAEFYAAKARAIRKISGFFQPAAKTKAR